MRALFDAWIEQRLDHTLKGVGQFVADQLNRERDHHQRNLADEVKSLRIELGALQDALDELRRTLDAADERGSGMVVDWLRARANNESRAFPFPNLPQFVLGSSVVPSNGGWDPPTIPGRTTAAHGQAN